jgi:hypothetical protein
MDQALILSTLSGLYEKLVADVAAQVVATMAEKSVFADDATMRAIASAVFEEKIDGALENYDCSDAIADAVADAVKDIDLSNKVKDGLLELRLKLVTR